MAQTIPLEVIAKERLNLLVSVYSLFTKNLLEAGLDLEKVKTASDQAWGVLGIEAGKQIKEHFKDAPVSVALFNSGNLPAAVLGMELTEEILESEKRVELHKCPWHDAAESLQLPREWRLCESGHCAFVSQMLKAVSPSATFEMTKSRPAGDGICAELLKI